MKKFLSIAIVVAVLFSCKLSVNAAGLKDIFSADYYADSYEDLYAAFEYDEAKLFKPIIVIVALLNFTTSSRFRNKIIILFKYI